MKIKTNQLTGAALDWAVAEASGTPIYRSWKTLTRMDMDGQHYWQPSIDWAQGGPIIERERIELKCWDGTWGVEKGTWVAEVLHEDRRYGGVMSSEGQGPTILLAAMRCYVASKLCDQFTNEVDVPDELVK